MSNEELVAAIQTGESRMEQLWEQTRKFIAMKARHTMLILGENPRIEIDDLMQSGYLALEGAVRTYKPSEGTFLAWLTLYLKTAFADCGGYRTSKQANDPIRYALSTDAPLDGGKKETYISQEPDHKATSNLEHVEDNLYVSQLRAALNHAMERIPANYSDILCRRYYGGKELKEIAKEKNISAERVRQLEGKGIRAMRMPEIMCELASFAEYDFYLGAGLTSFRNSGLSIQEKYLIVMEKRKKNHK